MIAVWTCCICNGFCPPNGSEARRIVLFHAQIECATLNSNTFESRWGYCGNMAPDLRKRESGASFIPGIQQPSNKTQQDRTTPKHHPKPPNTLKCDRGHNW